MTPDQQAETTAFLALGSNVGDRRSHLAHAIRRLDDEDEVTGLSRVFESEPVGYVDQPPFLNMVVRLCTRRSPRELLDLALAIEGERGRERTFRGAPRTLDVDVLLHGRRVVDEPGLELPHPRMADRPFVLVPLLELERGLREPGTGRSYAELLSRLVTVDGHGRELGLAEPDRGVGVDGDVDLRELGLRVYMDGAELTG